MINFIANVPKGINVETRKNSNLLFFSFYSDINSKLMQEFPPTSKLDSKVYGDQTSKITKEHIENNIDGLSIDEVYS